MEAYSSFAQVYDLFMDNVPYEEWSRYLISLLKEYQVTDGTVVELGCGTGKMTRLLADAGYDMVGVDNSAEMLEIAGAKRNAIMSTIKNPARFAELEYCLQGYFDGKLAPVMKQVRDDLTHKQLEGL